MGVGEEPATHPPEAALRRLAYRDELTHLPNRIAMADRIRSALARSSREGSCSALLFVDVDGMGRVNATLGHAAGDDLLRLIAARFTDHVGGRVTVGRHGSDEFLLLLDDLPPEPAHARSAVEEFADGMAASLRRPFQVARSTFEVSASAGASLFPLDASSDHDLFAHAGQAMSVAKRRGGAQLVMFDQPQQHSLLELEASQRVRRGLVRREFELFYQPVVDISGGGRLAGLEALLRWRDPDRGLLTPDAFLPFLEQSALVEEVGEWVFSEVCRQLAEWDGRRFSPPISFNIPARQLRRPDFAELILTATERHRVDLSRIAAEITETSPVSLDEVLPTLTVLREAGMTLSLDDFGTGYSSLARLRAMPFSVLKTDRSFMNGIPGDRVAGELLRGIIALGATLGLDVVVEGVESGEQELALRALGARLVQGYHVGAPAPADAIEACWASPRADGLSLSLDRVRSSPAARRTARPPR